MKETQNSTKLQFLLHLLPIVSSELVQEGEARKKLRPLEMTTFAFLSSAEKANFLAFVLDENGGM